ncbi:MAG: DNA-binding protein [Clostridium sp.]|uniref:DNA-binding protein n=1 Tax=Clostridium sp. TaxID=1506 RepID=UPI0039E95037
MLTPRNFANKTGLSYNQVLEMCKDGELKTVRTNRGHFKISDIELDKFIKNDNYISKEKYEELIRENEKLKFSLAQLKKYVENLTI